MPGREPDDEADQLIGDRLIRDTRDRTEDGARSGVPRHGQEMHERFGQQSRLDGRVGVTEAANDRVDVCAVSLGREHDGEPGEALRVRTRLSLQHMGQLIRAAAELLAVEAHLRELLEETPGG